MSGVCCMKGLKKIGGTAFLPHNLSPRSRRPTVRRPAWRRSFPSDPYTFRPRPPGITPHTPPRS